MGFSMGTVSVFGLNHRTANLDLRTRLALKPNPELLDRFCRENQAEQVLILSTCNRTEIYSDAQVSQDQLMDWLMQQDSRKDPSLSSTFTRSNFYYLKGKEALIHGISVASSLDSLLMGEAQILGQFKKAYQLAAQAGFIKAKLHLFLNTVFQTAKTIRQATSMSRCPVSMAYLALHTAGFERFHETKILLLGAGEMAKKIMEHLSHIPLKAITLLNRSLDKAEILAQQLRQSFPALNFSYEALNTQNIQKYMVGPLSCDIVISTVPEESLIGKDLFSPGSLHQSLLFIDLAVPRSIDKRVTEFPQIELLDMDEIQTFIEKNQKYPHQATEKAADLIKEASLRYEQKIAARKAIPSIVKLRQSMESTINQELHKALQALKQGQSSEILMRKLAYRIKQKCLHIPSKKLHSAASQGRDELFQMAHELFDLNP